MRIVTLILTFTGLIFAFASPAQAQRDIGDVLGDIFGGGPVQSQPLPGRIETIPVDVLFDFRDVYPGLPPEATLIVTAYAPPPANVRRTHPLMIGETRLLLSDLKPPLRIVIAAPASITRPIPYARIEARIVDVNGRVILEAERSGEYRGRRPARMQLIKPRSPAGSGQPQPASAVETIHGSVTINGHTPDLRGASLTIQLIEETLAGSRSGTGGQIIHAEKHIALDHKSPPFKFDMLRGTQAKTPTGPLVFKAWITDWAGRKILELPTPVPYTGSKFDYHLVLEGAHGIASPNPSVTGPTSPPLSGTTRIEGQVSFNAYKGLPVGSQILIDLERQDYRALPAQIASQRLSVTGTQGPVNFTLDVKRADLDPKLPAPSLRVRIIDTRGRILFSNPGGTPLKTGRNHINLRPSPNY